MAYAPPNWQNEIVAYQKRLKTLRDWLARVSGDFSGAADPAIDDSELVRMVAEVVETAKCSNDKLSARLRGAEKRAKAAEARVAELELTLEDDACVDAINECFRLADGSPNWDYPGQLVHLVRSLLNDRARVGELEQQLGSCQDELRGEKIAREHTAKTRNQYAQESELLRAHVAAFEWGIRRALARLTYRNGRTRHELTPVEEGVDILSSLVPGGRRSAHRTPEVDSSDGNPDET